MSSTIESVSRKTRSWVGHGRPDDRHRAEQERGVGRDHDAPAVAGVAAGRDQQEERAPARACRRCRRSRGPSRGCGRAARRSTTRAAPRCRSRRRTATISPSSSQWRRSMSRLPSPSVIASRVCQRRLVGVRQRRVRPDEGDDRRGQTSSPALPASVVMKSRSERELCASNAADPRQEDWSGSAWSVLTRRGASSRRCPRRGRTGCRRAPRGSAWSARCWPARA